MDAVLLPVVRIQHRPAGRRCEAAFGRHTVFWQAQMEDLSMMRRVTGSEGPSAVPTTLKCCEAGSRVSPPYPVSPFSATFCRRTEASGGSGPYMGIFRIIIRSKIGVSKNYENYSFYNPRFLSPYMGLFLSQRWSLFIIVRSLFARVIKIAHCSFFRTFAHGIIRFGRLSAGY